MRKLKMMLVMAAVLGIAGVCLVACSTTTKYEVTWEVPAVGVTSFIVTKGTNGLPITRSLMVLKSVMLG